MAVITINDLTRNGAVQVLAVQTEATSTEALSAWRHFSAGGSTLGTTGSTDEGFATFDIDERIAFIVSWANSSDNSTFGPTLTVSAGSDRRAYKAGQGTFSFFPAGSATGSTAAWSGKRWLVGPFESARFARETTAGSTAARGTAEGRNHIQFTLTNTSGEQGNAGRVNIAAFKLPVVGYAT